MFERLQNSWELVKASARVLSADKELLVFPIVSSIGVMIVSATFAIPMFLSGMFDALYLRDGFQLAGILVAFLFYIVQYFVIFYANSALVGAALIRLRGGDPTVADGFRIANSHLLNILGYSVIAATVGMILKSLSENRRTSGIARFVISLLGMAWNLATYLVVPVLVVEGLGPIDALKRSVELLKRTWGEQIAGNLGLGAVFGLINFAIILVTIPLIILTAVNEIWFGVIILALALIVVLTLVNLVSGALTGIYTAAVYRYAAEGQTSSFFEPQLVQQAFVQR